MLLLASLAIPGAPAGDRAADAPSETEIRNGAEALLERAESLIPEDATVIAGRCCGELLRLDAEDLRKLRDRKLFLLLPRRDSPIDVRVQVPIDTRAFEYRTVQITARDRADASLWFTDLRTDALHRDDYSLSLALGAFESRAIGRLEGSNYFHWQQNNEYRLFALSAPLEPSDPAFSVILEDQLLLTVTSAPNPENLLPRVRPAVSLHPGSLGVAVAGGKAARYKISVGAGYALSFLPFAAPNSATQGFLRLRIRFK